MTTHPQPRFFGQPHDVANPQSGSFVHQSGDRGREISVPILFDWETPETD